MFKRKSNKKAPVIPTAALPDIIFILLFFFMITSQQKPVRDLVDATIPTEERVKKAPKSKYIIHMNIGKPLDKSRGSEPVIQFMEGNIIAVNQIMSSVDNYKQSEMSESNRGKEVVVHLSVDESVKYGLIEDVQTELRKSGIYKIMNMVKKNN